MTHHKVNILISLLALFLSGCGQGAKERTIEHFPVDKTLKAERVAALDTMYAAYAVALVGDRYVLTCKRAPCFFYVYDRQFRPVASLAVPGNGEGEWLAPVYTGQSQCAKGTTEMYVLERPTQKLYKVPLRQNARREEVADLSKRQLDNLRYAFRIGNGQYVGAQDDGQCLPFILNGEKKTELTHPLPDADKMGDKARLLLQTQGTLRHGNDLWADAYYSFPMVVIRQADGTMKEVVKIGRQWPRRVKEQDEPADYCLDICSSPEAIYILFNDPSLPKESSVVAIGWDGNPLARYHIQRATAMTVDEAAKCIIAINEDEDCGMFSRYRL